MLSTTTDPKTFNPITAQETSSTQIIDLMFEGLTSINPFTGDVIPLLAERWEHDETGRIWTFYLRDDVYFSDGTKLTAHDVYFTFKHLIYNKDIMTSARSIFLIDGREIILTVIDDTTIQFVLPKQFAPFLRSLSQPILPKHVVSKYVEKKTFNEAWNVGIDVTEVIGSGPFKLSSYVPGEKVVLKKNTHYWKKNMSGGLLPYLNNIVFLVVPSQDVALLKFKNKEIDVYALRGIDYPWLKPLEAKGYFSLYKIGPSFGTSFLTFNQNEGINPQNGKPFVERYKLLWFRSKLFRQAIAHCINRDQIIAIVLNGLGVKQNSPMSPSSGYFYTADTTEYGYDLEKARTLLAQQGFKDSNNDGILEDTEGNPISFNLYTNAETPERLQIANLIRKDLSKVGIEVKFTQLEFNTLVNKVTVTKDWDSLVFGFTGGIEPHFGANVWMSNAPLHIWNPSQPEPSTGWERRIDELFEQAAVEMNKKRRKVLYDEWQRIVSDEVPLIYLAISDRIIAVNNRLKNIKSSPLGGVLRNIEEIYIDPSQRN